MIKQFLWAGSEESAAEMSETIKRGLEKFGSFDAALEDGEEENENPIAYQVQEGLAIITVQGGTWSQSNRLTRYYGIPTYDDIRERIIQAVDDPEVKRVMLNIDSPGGRADGVKALSRFIDMTNKVKPIHTYTQGMMASAALWYGTASREVMADEDAKVGSLGAIMIHFEYTEAMKREGVKATVFRTAPLKALGQPYEKLTEQAERHIRKEMQTLHDKFVNGIALNKGLPVATVSTQIATGETFDAPRAKDLGLVDRIVSLDEAIARLVRLDHTSHVPSGSGSSRLEESTPMAKKLVLSQALLAAAALGANVDAIETAGLDGAANADADAEAAAAEVVASEAAAAAAAELAAVTTAPVTTTVPVTPATPVAANSELIAHLREEAKELKTVNSALTVENAEMKKKLETLEPANQRLVDIVRVSTTRLAIAMGGQPFGIDLLEGAALADQFNKLNGEFEKRFVVGGKSVANADAAQTPGNVVKAPVRSVGLNATKLR